MLTALTHQVSPQMAHCELTFIARQMIDLDLAQRQHAGYSALLQRCGAAVVELSVNLDFPDACFIEDTAVVLDEVAILTHLGAPSRRGESERIEEILSRYRPVRRILPPATLEGGDVLRVGKKLYVGLSSRTNSEGVAALTEIVQADGYTVIPVRVRGSLHLKTACTALDEETLLVNPDWIDLEPLRNIQHIFTPPEEPWGSNTLRIGDTICLPEGFPRTLERVQSEFKQVETIDISEFRKSEGGLTCLSILFHTG